MRILLILLYFVPHSFASDSFKFNCKEKPGGMFKMMIDGSVDLLQKKDNLGKNVKGKISVVTNNPPDNSFKDLMNVEGTYEIKTPGKIENLQLKSVELEGQDHYYGSTFNFTFGVGEAKFKSLENSGTVDPPYYRGSIDLVCKKE
jgi:hypothetical protein